MVEGSDISSRSITDERLELPVVRDTDTHSWSITDDQPSAWGAAASHGPADTSSRAQQQSMPAQASPKSRLEHGSISSGRLLPQPTANGTTVNGHLDAAVDRTATSAAPAEPLRDGSTRHRSDPEPLDEPHQLEPSLLMMPAAVRTLLHRCVNLLCLCKLSSVW